MMCARWGADVIKIDPPEPRYGPLVMVGFGLLANRGKRSVLLNLRTAEGHAAFARLVAGADVVTFNGIDRQLEALGITPARLKAMNPRAILYMLKAFAGPFGGRAPRASATTTSRRRRPASWRASAARCATPRSTRTSARSTS